MEDNHYRTDVMAIRENQENRVAVLVSNLDEPKIKNPLIFVKENINGIKIRDRKTEPDFKEFVWAILFKHAALAGIKGEIDSFNFSDIMKMVFSSFSDLTVEEIHKALELERHSQYEVKTEHFQLFNAEYVSTILKKYKQWRLNVKIQHNLTATTETKTTEVDQGEINKLLTAGIVERYEHYIATKEMISPFAHLFDYLYEKQIIKNPTTPALENYFAKVNSRAKEQIREELANKRAITKDEKRDFAKQFSDVLNGTSNAVLVRAKRIVLQDFFNNIFLNGKDINEILDATRT